ncbi:MAG: alpha/beta fold hydrolase, partial [Gammaproteobacteria bacterium]|nr:alpha/beta fold hydrolase [Gammaproteobacteria bacterium]
MKVEQRSVTVRGIDMAYAEWGGQHATTVLLAHATGFHGRCWDGVVRELGDGVRVLAPDLRGHGRTTKRGPYD